MKKEYLLTAKEMQTYDKNASEQTGIPSLVLMERAAYASAECVMKYLQQQGKKHQRILVVAGMGNNGGDAVATGRILREYGYEVTLYLIGKKEQGGEQLNTQLSILAHYEVFPIEEISTDGYDVIVDGILGIGLSREVTGDYRRVVETINKSNAFIISLDIPSGLNADTGTVMGQAVKADMTITYGFLKRGLFFGDGPKYCGKIKLAGIGIDETSFYGTKPEMFTYYEREGSFSKIDLKRQDNGNKGTFGKVAIFAGNKESAGAALLCGTSAFRSGCGMVHVVSHYSNKEALLHELPEAIFTGLHGNIEEDNDRIQQVLKWADVIAVGPAMGLDESAKNVLELILTSNKPMVIDADGITLLAQNKELREKLIAKQENPNTRSVLIFTPHRKELSLFSGIEMQSLQSNMWEVCEKMAKTYYGIVVAKDAKTIVCGPLSGEKYYNLSGSDALATAGSGDVLTGLVASLCGGYLKKDVIPYENEEIAQDNESVMKRCFFAACMAVYLHGRAGEYAAGGSSNSYVIARDIYAQYMALF